MLTLCSGCQKEDAVEKVKLGCGHCIHSGLDSRVLELARKRPFFQVGKFFACARVLDDETSLPFTTAQEDPRGCLICPACGTPLSMIECCQVLDRESYLILGSERETSQLIRDALTTLAKAWSPSHATEFEKQKSPPTPLQNPETNPTSPSAAKLNGMHQIMELMLFYKNNPHPRMGDILTEAVLEANLKDSDQEKALDLINQLMEGENIFDKKDKSVSGVGTGYGGDESLVLQSAAKERERLQREQILRDNAVSRAFNELRRAIDEGGNDLAAPTEAIMRREWGALSCLAEYLRNGEITNITQREPVYIAAIELCEAIARRPLLVPLLLSNNKVKKSVKWSPEAALALAKTKANAQQSHETAYEIEGTALVENIQAICSILEDSELKRKFESCLVLIEHSRQQNPHFHVLHDEASVRQTAIRVCCRGESSFEQINNSYKKIMGKYSFRFLNFEQEAIPHYYLKPSLTGSEQGSQATGAASSVNQSKDRMNAIRTTIAALKSSCPVEWYSSVFCIVDENRFDMLSFLIIGPDETPYQNGCFHFDMRLPADFPDAPPLATFLTTGGGRTRFNPNLYADGKICLSLLGTWAGPRWNPTESTVLQVLLSIQSLILCSEPYFNEPGHESLRTTARGKELASQYAKEQMINTMRLAILGMLNSPARGFEAVIRDHFRLKQRAIREQLTIWGKSFAEDTPFKELAKSIEEALERNETQ